MNYQDIKTLQLVLDFLGDEGYTETQMYLRLERLIVKLEQKFTQII